VEAVKIAGGYEVSWLSIADTCGEGMNGEPVWKDYVFQKITDILCGGMESLLFGLPIQPGLCHRG